MTDRIVADTHEVREFIETYVAQARAAPAISANRFGSRGP
jgi:hypothetical protein